MKLRHPALIATAAWTLSKLVRVWIGSNRYDYRPRGPRLLPRDLPAGQRVIYAFWHEDILTLAHRFGRPDITVLASKHADGQLIADLAERLGFSSVRGSTGRGGVAALKKMVELSATNHLAVMPDGPRGPRRTVSPGVVYLAAKSGLPIVPCGLGYSAAWRAKSWDHFALPKPFGRTVMVTPELFAVPPDADLEASRTRLDALMNELSDEAQRHANGMPGPRRLAEVR